MLPREGHKGPPLRTASSMFLTLAECSGPRVADLNVAVQGTSFALNRRQQAGRISEAANIQRHAARHERQVIRLEPGIDGISAFDAVKEQRGGNEADVSGSRPSRSEGPAQSFPRPTPSPSRRPLLSRHQGCLFPPGPISEHFPGSFQSESCLSPPLQDILSTLHPCHVRVVPSERAPGTPCRDFAVETYRTSYDASMILVIAAICFPHSWVSAVNCLRPRSVRR